jgi:glycosyltransferase involved in cell wall biosynthesis
MAWYKLSDLHAEMTAFASCMAGRSDMVHFLDGEHSGRFLPGALKAGGGARKKTIATFHQPPELAKDLLHPPALRLLDHVVLVSPSQIPFFREHVAEERLSVILHGVDTDFFHPASSANSTERVRCITVGRWLRDWATFANVARSLPDVHFDVVSNRDLGIGPIANVRVHQNLNDAELAALYRRADILFLPLLQSTANNALLEGLASGLAVVATDLEAVRAYVPNGDAILTTGGTDEFVTTIRSLQRDVGFRHKMQSKARTRGESLAWPTLVRRYEALYSKLGSC